MATKSRAAASGVVFCFGTGSKFTRSEDLLGNMLFDSAYHTLKVWTCSSFVYIAVMHVLVYLSSISNMADNNKYFKCKGDSVFLVVNKCHKKTKTSNKSILCIPCGAKARYNIFFCATDLHCCSKTMKNS